MDDKVTVYERPIVVTDPASPEGDKCVRVWYTLGADGNVTVLKTEDWEPQVIYLKPQQD